MARLDVPELLGQALGGAKTVPGALKHRASYDSFREEHHIGDSPDAVILWLTHLLDTEHLSGNALRRRLRSLDASYALEGRASPSRDQHVRTYLHGLHKEAALGPIEEREPLYLEDVLAMVDTIRADRFQQSRDIALLLLANATGLSYSGMALLTWNDLRCQKNRVFVHAHAHGYGPHGRLEINADDSPRAVAAAKELRRQAGSMCGPIFARHDDKAPRCQVLGDVLRRLPGRGKPWSRSATGPVPEDSLGDQIEALSVLRPRQRRDVALLLLGFAACLEGEEARKLSFRDVTISTDGLTLRVCGRRGSTGVPRGRRLEYDPVSAWESWVEDAAARGRSAQDAAFPGILRETVLANALGRGALTQIVQQRAQRAGLQGGYSFTSLRGGFLRTAVRQGVPQPLILQQAGIRNVSSLEVHRRREQLISHSVVSLLGL
jgi:site-specific recombinase XerD